MYKYSGGRPKHSSESPICLGLQISVDYVNYSIIIANIFIYENINQSTWWWQQLQIHVSQSFSILREIWPDSSPTKCICFLCSKPRNFRKIIYLKIAKLILKGLFITTMCVCVHIPLWLVCTMFLQVPTEARGHQKEPVVLELTEFWAV